MLEQLSQQRLSPEKYQPVPRQDFDCDLIVVGGGIVGTTLVAALKHSKLKVILVEAQAKSVSVAQGRAYVLSLLSGQIFEGIGIWNQISERVTTFQEIQISDADDPGIVHFTPQELGRNCLGYAAEHGVLLNALQQHIQDTANITWLCPAKVVKIDYQTDSVAVEVEINGEKRQLRSRLVVAADGAKSPMRQAVGIRTYGWRYWQSCVVATINTEFPHHNVAYERFWSTGPMGVLPLSGNRCQVVWTAPHGEAQALKDLEVGQFLQKLEYHTGGKLGKLSLVGERHLFPVQLLQSDRYTLNRLALIGDAAHCCHPVAGQGMNMGIRDAAALAEVLTTAYDKGEDIGSLKVLKRYQTWRKRENLWILAFTDFLDRIFSNNWLPIVGLRRLGLWMLRFIPMLKIYSLKLMTGLKGRHPKIAVNPVNRAVSTEKC
ncbi:FAD-dependent hydroxylase [Merismopedia glauca]|uniref:2-octaprenyl-6-methoxyphenyl hydroxylase n=1 Tax=Merismopedia glauca CCAP 1448/3 TaxID=1296344 RepID=A0A2T1C209_9CYAN|nr:FAD-dependent hydroxylase [Merismopedia glauca]PSB02187.1 2-octaprenyl-6-methoxyphenyl hydroxylase [Merismopedia glauca CCAP 1448/3]